ncbi:MAG: hypothetical protein KDE58_24750, partial [Caldilineaceae bacterium]|nr:hypothetical protein [Caldilineaceae bacterium]
MSEPTQVNRPTPTAAPIDTVLPAPMSSTAEDASVALLHAFAHLLQEWSDRVQQTLDEVAPAEFANVVNPMPNGAAPVPADTAAEPVSSTGGPPAHWLAHVQQAGAPAHWLADIRRAQGAPRPAADGAAVDANGPTDAQVEPPPLASAVKPMTDAAAFPPHEQQAHATEQPIANEKAATASNAA